MKQSGWSSKAVKAIGIVIVTYGFLGFIVLPWVIEGQAKFFLEERLSIAATIDKVRLNPFALSITVEGLDLIDADSHRLMSFDRLYANFQLSSIFSRAASFRTVHLDGLHVDLARYSETDSNISRLAARWESLAAPAEETSEVANRESEIFPLLIADFRLQEASLAVSDMVPDDTFKQYVDSINISLANLSTLPNENTDQTLSISMGNGAKISWTGELSLSPLSSVGQVEIVGPYPKLAYEYFSDKIPVIVEDGWFDAAFDYRFELDAESSPQISLTNLNANLQTLNVRDKTSMSLLASISNVALSEGELRWPASTFTAQELALSGFDFYPERNEVGQINFLALLPESAEDVNADPVAASEQVSEPWQISLGELNLNDWHILFTDEVPTQRFEIDLGLNLALANVSNEDAAEIGVAASLDIGEQGRIGLEGNLQVLPEPIFSGAVTLEELPLSIAQAYVADFAHVSLDGGVLSLEGQVAYAASDARFNGGVMMHDLLITDTVENETLFSLASVSVDDANVGYGGELSINVAEIRLDVPYARIEIEADGTNNISRVLVQKGGVVVESASSSGDEEGLPAAVTIQHITLLNGRADFADLSLPLPFSVAIAGLEGEVSALSSGSSEPARIAIDGQVDEFGLATIKGEILPLAFAQLTDIDLSFRNLNMPAMTPYVIKFAGRYIDDGRMDVDLSYVIHDGLMQGDNSLVLRDLELGRRQDYPDALDLPLGLAIALLKNADGVIDLSVPVVGDVNSPQFQYGPVVSQALANIIRNIVASPFKLLAGLVGGGEDEEIGVINFVPGRSVLAPPEREKLTKLAQALEQRPQLGLGLVGVYHAESDGVAIRTRRVDERVQSALTQTRDAGENALAQTAVLEAMYGAAIGQQAAIDLIAWRLARTTGQDAAESFDELAYAGDIRRALIAIEPISEADLSALGVERTSTIAAALTVESADFASKVRLQPPVAVERLERGSVSLELGLEPL